MAATWPGELSYDSVIQLLEGRTAIYSGWHPPAMSWLLGLADAAWRGAGLYVLATALALFAAIGSLGWTMRRPSWAGVPVAAVAMITPQFVLYQGTVWKDVLFADAMVTGFVVLAHAAAHWRNAVRRNLLLGLAAALLILAALARQNGAIVLPAAALALALVARRHGAKGPQAGMLGIAFLALGAAAAVGVDALLGARIADPANVARQIRLLEFYDLAGALSADPELPLPQLERTHPHLLALMRSDASRLYSPAKSDTLVRSARLQAALAAAPTGALHRSWLGLVRHRTALYLRERAGVFRWVFATPDIVRCVPYIVGQRGPPAVLRALHMPMRVSPRDRMVDRYGKWLMNTPVFSHALFFALALGEFVFLAFRRRSADLVFACLLAGSGAFAASFFFLAIACDYRYLYPLDLSALTVALYVALSLRASEEKDVPEARH